MADTTLAFPPQGESEFAPPAAEKANSLSPQPRRWRAEALKPGPGMANAARWELAAKQTDEAPERSEVSPFSVDL